MKSGVEQCELLLSIQETIVFRKSLNNRVFLDILSFFPISEIFKE